MFRDKRRADLARALADLGVWADLTAEEADEQVRAVQAGDYPLTLAVFDDAWFTADGEDLAEGEVEELLRTMTSALARHGVALSVQTLEVPQSVEGSYVVGINGRRCQVWGPDDEERLAWALATVRPLAIVNDLLADAGATVRVFVLSAGSEDGVCLLLDPRVVEAMRRSRLFDKGDLPELCARSDVL